MLEEQLKSATPTTNDHAPRTTLTNPHPTPHHPHPLPPPIPQYRKVVAEWMVDVCEYFTLDATTTHAAIAYLDRLQPNEKFSRFEWQMLAICCILIASKYNECEDHVPDLSTLEEITQQSIPNETVLNYELWAL